MHRRALQAYERQVDHLGRQLSRDAADTGELARERETLLEELRAAQQVSARLSVGRAAGCPGGSWQETAAPAVDWQQACVCGWSIGGASAHSGGAAALLSLLG